MTPLAIDVPPDLVEAIAERAAELVAERQEAPADGWLRGGDEIATYIGAPTSRVYALVSARRIPVHKDGSSLVARRSELDAWLLNEGVGAHEPEQRACPGRTEHPCPR